MRKWIGQDLWGECERESRKCSQWVEGHRLGRLRGRSSRHKGGHCRSLCRRRSGWTRRRRRREVEGTCVEMDTGLGTARGLGEASGEPMGGSNSQISLHVNTPQHYLFKIQIQPVSSSSPSSFSPPLASAVQHSPPPRPGAASQTQVASVCT